LHDLTNFYKRFFPYFSILVALLIELVRNHVPSWEDAQEGVFRPYPTPTYQTPLIYMFLFFLQVLREKAQSFKGEGMMQSYPPRALDKRLQENWARDAGEGARVLMSFRVDFGPMG